MFPVTDFFHATLQYNRITLSFSRFKVISLFTRHIFHYCTLYMSYYSFLRVIFFVTGNFTCHIITIYLFTCHITIYNFLYMANNLGFCRLYLKTVNNYDANSFLRNKNIINKKVQQRHMEFSNFMIFSPR